MSTLTEIRNSLLAKPSVKSVSDFKQDKNSNLPPNVTHHSIQVYFEDASGENVQNFRYRRFINPDTQVEKAFKIDVYHSSENLKQIHDIAKTKLDAELTADGWLSLTLIELNSKRYLGAKSAYAKFYVDVKVAGKIEIQEWRLYKTTGKIWRTIVRVQSTSPKLDSSQDILYTGF